MTKIQVLQKELDLLDTTDVPQKYWLEEGARLEREIDKEKKKQRTVFNIYT